MFSFNFCNDIILFYVYDLNIINKYTHNMIFQAYYRDQYIVIGVNTK